MTQIETLELSASAPRVWDLLVQPGGALGLVPGLRAGSSGRGTLRVVLGGHSVTYRGYARQHVEEPGKRVTWTLSGREVRGNGRGHVEVRARVKSLPGGGSDLRLTVLVEGRGRLEAVTEAELVRATRSLVSHFRGAVEAELGGSQGQAAPAAPGRAASPAVPPGPAPELEILPPSVNRGGERVNSVAIAAGGLLLGAVLVLVWRARLWRRI